MRQAIFPFFALFLLSLSSNVFSEYKTKSVFSDDYKCVSHEKGGFNHTKDGHVLTRFHGKEEFFITHITNIPDEAMRDAVSYYKIFDHLSGKDLDTVREHYEMRFFPEPYDSRFPLEKGSYSISTPEDNPRKAVSYSNKCMAYKSDKGGSISCEYYFKDFMLDLTTMRFTYVVSGSWHSPDLNNNYYGDSSVFAFGTCKKYFR